MDADVLSKRGIRDPRESVGAGRGSQIPAPRAADWGGACQQCPADDESTPAGRPRATRMSAQAPPSGQGFRPDKGSAGSSRPTAIASCVRSGPVAPCTDAGQKRRRPGVPRRSPSVCAPRWRPAAVFGTESDDLPILLRSRVDAPGDDFRILATYPDTLFTTRPTPPRTGFFLCLIGTSSLSIPPQTRSPRFRMLPMLLALTCERSSTPRRSPTPYVAFLFRS